MSAAMAGNSFSSVNISQRVWFFPLVFLFFQDTAQQYLMKNTKHLKKIPKHQQKYPTQRLIHLFNNEVGKRFDLSKVVPVMNCKTPFTLDLLLPRNGLMNIGEHCSARSPAHPTPPHQLQPR